MNKLLLHDDETRLAMLKRIGLNDIDELFSGIDSSIRLREELDLPNALSELEVRQKLTALSNNNANTANSSYFIGGGCYNKFIPACVPYLTQRSEFLTAYTPYQPEISQGSLQSIYEYQTMICNITGMDISNAGVYDGATACAEAVLMACRIKKNYRVLVGSSINPQYLEVVKTYTHAQNIEVDLIPLNYTQLNVSALDDIEAGEYACILVQYQNYFGDIEDLESVSETAQRIKSLMIVCAEPSSLFILKQPSEFNADIVVGDIQALGIPMSMGGAHAGYMATKKEFMRQLPGRIVGMTKDKDGQRAFTLTQQAREQHIRRDKATSNICSNQAAVCLAATIYLAYMGYDMVREMLDNSISKAQLLAKKISEFDGFEILNKNYLNEFVVKFPSNVSVTEFLKLAQNKKIFAGIVLEDNFEKFKNCLLVATTELNSVDEIYNYISLIKEFTCM